MKHIAAAIVWLADFFARRPSAVLLTFLVCMSVLVLTSCGAPEKGDVISKEYKPEREWTTSEPDYDTKTYSCRKTKTETKTVNGKTTSKQVGYTGTCTKQVRDGYDIVDHYSPEEFLLKIQDGDNVGWVEVSESTYEDAEVGDYYDNGSIR